MTSPSADRDAPRIDWTQWLFPGPRRVFSAAEIERAGGPDWPVGIDCLVYSHVAVMAAVIYQMLPRGQAPFLIAGGFGLACGGLAVARLLWRSPTRKLLNIVSLLASVLLVALMALLVRLGLRAEMRDNFPLISGGLVMVVSSWWFLTLYRVQQIESRLRELDAQQERVSMAQRLATAQIQPHFLFNTLASLQHWVDTRDDRAGPMLRSLTRYLRATLPMFQQERLPLEQELHIVRSYLEIMQARLGERLRWSEHIDEAARAALPRADLPPGALLTLAENAITHGIEPSLRGGEIELRVSATPAALRLSVRDSGRGLAPGACDGLGLGNTRERLRARYGDSAALGLSPADPGCLAWIDLPWPDASIATAAPGTSRPDAMSSPFTPAQP